MGKILFFTQAQGKYLKGMEKNFWEVKKRAKIGKYRELPFKKELIEKKKKKGGPLKKIKGEKDQYFEPKNLKF